MLPVLFCCLSWELVKFCVCPSFPFGIEGGMWDVIVLIPDHCLSIYFRDTFQRNKNIVSEIPAFCL